MFERTYYATHPDMMECVSNEELRDRYLISGLFRDGECVLNYTHADRFVIGGVAVTSGEVKLPDQTEPPSAAGHPFLERRELAIVNVGAVDGVVTVDGERFELGNKDCLYVMMGAKDVTFSGDGRASISHRARRTRRSRLVNSASPTPTRSIAAASRNRTSGRSISSSFPASATARSSSWG